MSEHTAPKLNKVPFLVGDALLLRRRRKDGVTARLYSIAVDANHRGKGFGKALLSNCLDALKAEGVSTVHLEVDVDNAPAIALYESFGYTKIRRLAGYYGPGKDGWKMQLKLPCAQGAEGSSAQKDETQVGLQAQ